jgi:tetratricopeptide (TPR) repeat protein
VFHPEIKKLNPVKKLREEGKLREAFQLILELEQEGDLSFKDFLLCKLIKADLYSKLGKHLDAIEIAKETYQEVQKLGDLISSLDALLIQAYSYGMILNLSESKDIIKQAEDLFKIIKAELSIDLRERESFLMRIKGIFHFSTGELHLSLEFSKKAYELVKDTGNKELISKSLNNIADKYHHMKEYDKAIEYAKEALKIKNNPFLTAVLGTLIEIYVSKGDIKESRVYLDHLREYSKKGDSKSRKIVYHHSKALVLKSSLRARDRIKAEDLLKEIVMDKTLLGYLRIEAIIDLCDLYLTELRITNDPEIINDIHPYIQELQSIAEKHHLYIYLAETLLLQAKLSLLMLSLKKTKQFLTQAQKIAESYGLKRIAMKISYEHDELLRQTKMWENLKTSGISLSERLELTGLNEQMKNMLKRGIIEVPEISKEEPVMLLILTEGGDLMFSKRFIEEITFEDDVLGGFLTTINYIITEIFSEGLERAVFGEYTLLMMPLEPFLVCYIFKGYSYYAHRKIKQFLESIQNDNFIWQSLKSFLQRSKIIQENSILSLESLITDIFFKVKDKNMYKF